MNRRLNKPGNGWVHFGGGVWNHKPTGLRVHVGGLICRSGVSEPVSGLAWPECESLDRCIRVAGGNRRRGVMIWAMEWIEYRQQMIDEQKTH